ncbi:hypothetical protein [Nostoc sp.]|uniref:hypothetical protein n=1 Tax=Nostoc sp. TaxID=1180 RepID=UPI002FF6E25E
MSDAVMKFIFGIVKTINVKLRKVTFEDKFSGILGVIIGVVFIGIGFYANKKITHERAILTQTQGRVVDTVHCCERDSKDKEKTLMRQLLSLSFKAICFALRVGTNLTGLVTAKYSNPK